MKKELKLIRCISCKKGLFQYSEGLGGGIEIKCHRCKKINVIVFTEKDVFHSVKEDK